MEPWAPGAKCYVCGRLVADVSAWQDDDGGRWNAHWDCHQRAELKERARQAGSDESFRSMRFRLGAYTRWANADAQEPFAAGYRMRRGLQAKFEHEVDPEGKLSPRERAMLVPIDTTMIGATEPQAQGVKLPVSAPSGCSSRPQHQRDGYRQDDRADGLHHQRGRHQLEA
jgi:hypothetical protein